MRPKTHVGVATAAQDTFGFTVGVAILANQTENTIISKGTNIL